MSWPSRFRPAGRKLLVTVLAAAVALGLITAATVFGGSQQPTVTSVAPWEFAPHMPHRRSYTASAELGGKIYVAAGMVGNTGRPLNIFERFDPETNEWDSLPLVPEPFSAAAGAALGGTMYVIGGNGSSKAVGRQVAAYGDAPADGRQVFAYSTVQQALEQEGVAAGSAHQPRRGGAGRQDLRDRRSRSVPRHPHGVRLRPGPEPLVAGAVAA